MASDLVIHDTTIVTADAAATIHTDAAIAVTGDRIAAIGRTRDIDARYPDAERVSGRGRAVFPGFANTLVHQGQPGDVISVMVDGRWVMRDGRVLTIDEAAVVREARHVARSAWKRRFERRPDLTVPPGFDL